jgi:hypothetical protein
MTQDELNAHLGVGDMQTIVVDGKMLPGPCSAGPESLGSLITGIGEEAVTRNLLMFQHQTFMDICLGTLDLPSDRETYDVYLPVPMEIVVATPNGPDGMEMIICPQSGSRDKLGPGRFSLPMFEVEYHVGDIMPDVNFEVLCDSLDLLRLQFETELLLDLLSKSVRSQRNRVDAPLSSESISEAMELIERESRLVTNCVLNTKAFAAWREDIRSDGGRLFGATALCCSPRKRQNLRRNYFLGPRTMLGVFAMTTPTAEITPPDMTMRMRMGAAILDRSLISSVDGPQ